MQPLPVFAPYLKRIDAVAAPPSLENLRTLQEKHLQHVPFETLSLHLGEPIDLSPDRLLNKIVDRKRGGFCYELNRAFAGLLEHLGYGVQFIMTRPFKADGELAPPFAHLALKVQLDGQDFLVDVGFNDGSVHPFPLVEGHIENGCTLQKAGDVWTYIDLKNNKKLYVFDEQEHPFEAFFEMCRHYATHEDSGFRKKLFCGFQVPDHKAYLTDHKWVEDGQEVFLDRSAFANRLTRGFDIPLSEDQIDTLYLACVQRKEKAEQA